MKPFFLIIALFFTVSGFSQSPIFPDTSNTVLWGIVNAKGDTSYLLGTCHIVGNTFVDGYAPISAKYKKASCVVEESIDNGIFTKKDNWFKRLRPKDRHLINKYLKTTTPSFYLMSCRKIPPSFLYYLMLGEMALRECGTYNESDVCDMDAYIINGATTLNKKVYGLEERNEVLDTALFAHIGISSNEHAVIKIKDLVVNNKAYRDTVCSFCNCAEMNDYLKLKINYRFSKSSVEEESANAIVCDKRNDEWMPKLKTILNGNNAFIAVGLGHLYYKKGLIMQLAAAGYTVFPVAMQNTGPVKYVKKKKD